MIKELRLETNKSKHHYLSYLMNSGRITKYVNDEGFSCYDTEEYEEYKRNARRGRPVKGGMKSE